MVNHEKQIEVGKVYRTREGGKARIYALDGTGDFPVHGALLIEGGWSSATWTRSGYYIGHAAPNSNDLMGEWKDPHPLDRVKPGSPVWVRQHPESSWFLSRFVRVDENGNVTATESEDLDNTVYHTEWTQGIPYRAGKAPDGSFYENKDSE